MNAGREDAGLYIDRNEGVASERGRALIPIVRIIGR